MELTDFLHVGTISHKLKDDRKFLGWAWSEMGVPVWWWDSKIDCIWRMNRWNIWTDFLLVDTWSNILCDYIVKNECGQSGHRTQRWTDGIKSFFHAGTNSGKLKVDSIRLGGCGQKWLWLFSSWDHNICCNLRMNL